MSGPLSLNLRRRERTRRELHAFRAECAEWLQLRRTQDTLHPYHTQFDALEQCLLGAAQGLAARLDTLDTSLPAGHFADACRLHELRLLWLRRLYAYASPNVLSRILAGEIEPALGGERRRIAVLFSDIRGFTTLSEQLSPEEVVAFLNEFLEMMVDCVIEHGGVA